MSYVTQSGRNEECLDERVTLRDLQPFKNIGKAFVAIGNHNVGGAKCFPRATASGSR